MITIFVLIGLVNTWYQSNLQFQKNELQEQGKGVELIITPYSTTIFTNNLIGAPVMVRVADKNGNDVDDINSTLEIIIQGDGTIVQNKDHNIDSQTVKSIGEGKWETQVVKGISWFNLVAGDKPGKIKVEVRSEGFKPASSEIHSIEPFNEMKPKKRQIKPTGKKIDKMIGADISFLPQLESRGMKFSDNGIQKDVLSILKDHGFNYVRLRIFNNPAAEKGYSPKAGFCDLEHTKAMALRTRNAGMKLLLDFHYSDYWADPQQQNKPSAWIGLEGDKLNEAMRSYTREVIQALKDQGTLPEMVQIGNEINHGFIWPDGHIGNPDTLAELIKAGIQGVRDVDPSVIIMLHVALGGQNSESVFWFNNMFSRGVDCDVIGLSYYPRWHGTLNDLKDNMLDLISRYRKDIILVEYSQKKEELHEIVFSLPADRGKGTCIWEPLSTWEQVFDRQGNSNDMIKVYDRMAEMYLNQK